MIAALNIWLTKQRQSLPLKRIDLRDQLGRYEYWYRPPEGKKLAVRFGHGRGSAVSHPLGYQQVPDDDLKDLDDKKGDPRKGPLFTLIEWVQEMQRKADSDDENP